MKGTADTNAAALDKCLEALQTFLEKANESHAARHVRLAMISLFSLPNLLSSVLLMRIQTHVRYCAGLLVPFVPRLHPRCSSNALALFRKQRRCI